MEKSNRNRNKKILIVGGIAFLLWWLMRKKTTETTIIDNAKVDFDKPDLKVDAGIAEIVQRATTNNSERLRFENRVFFFDKKLPLVSIKSGITADLNLNGYIVSNLEFRRYAEFDAVERKIADYVFINGAPGYGLSADPKQYEMFIATVNFIPSKLAAATNGRYSENVNFRQIAQQVSNADMQIFFKTWFSGVLYKNNLLKFTYN